MDKLWEVSYYDNGVYITEYHEASTRMEARGCVIHRLKRQVQFEVVEVVKSAKESEVTA